MEKIELKNNSYAIILEEKYDYEVKEYLETEVDDVENIQETYDGFSFKICGENVKLSMGQCLLVDQGCYVDVISVEAFELLNKCKYQF